MTREDVVSTIDMVTIDGKSPSRHYGQDSLEDHDKGDVVLLGPADILGIRLGQHCDTHGDGSVEVQ